MRRPKLNKDEVLKIFFDSGSYKEFEEKYQVSPDIVRDIKKRKTYQSFTKDLDDPGQIKRNKLSNDDLSRIYESNASFDEIAREFQITSMTVRNIKNGITRNTIWYEF